MPRLITVLAIIIFAFPTVMHVKMSLIILIVIEMIWWCLWLIIFIFQEHRHSWHCCCCCCSGLFCIGRCWTGSSANKGIHPFEFLSWHTNAMMQYVILLFSIDSAWFFPSVPLSSSSALLWLLLSSSSLLNPFTSTGPFPSIPHGSTRARRYHKSDFKFPPWFNFDNKNSTNLVPLSTQKTQGMQTPFFHSL